MSSRKNFRLKTTEPTEDYEQIKAATYLTKNNILFYHIPNGGKRHMLEAIKFKRMGVKAGVPDICIPIARGCYHGLYIELKRSVGGVVSTNQTWWLAELKRQGYAVYVAQGADDLIQYVHTYLGARS